MKHKHEFTRSKPGATVETCRCGKFRHTENAGPAIAAQDSKHTPGPWAIARADGAPIIYQEGKDSAHFQPSAICEVYRYGGTRPTESNARLIAAAPDLLAALKLIEGVVNLEAWAIEEVSRLCADGYAETEEGVVDKIRRAAIAKAGGK